MKRDTGVVLALDETDPEKAMRIVSDVSDHIDAVKINWPLVLSAGPDMIDRLSSLTDVICDFKVADIPNTVRLIVENSVDRGASAVIVHAFTGDDSMRAAVEAAAGRADIIAVTEMSHPGGTMFTAQHAEELAKMGCENGANGFIAPATRPDRVRLVRNIVGDRMILTPGVGAQGGSASAAIEAGADYVIVGRAIYGADDPASVARSIAESIHHLL